MLLADAEHHGGGSPHAELMRGAMHVEPICGQAFQAGNLVTHLVVENLRAAAGNRIQPASRSRAIVSRMLSALYSAIAMISDAE